MLRRSRKLAWTTVVPATFALGLGLAGGVAVANGDDAGEVIEACVHDTNGQVRITEAACRNGETRVSWNQAGVQGPVGPQGPEGPQGPPGEPARITPGSITAEHLADDSVRTSKIADESVITSKLVDGTVTWGKLSIDARRRVFDLEERLRQIGVELAEVQGRLVDVEGRLHDLVDHIDGSEGPMNGSSGLQLHTTRLTGVQRHTVDVDPPAIGPGERFAVPVVIQSPVPPQPGDLLVVEPPRNLDPHLVFAGASLTAPGLITIQVVNLHHEAVDGPPQPWVMTAVDLNP